MNKDVILLANLFDYLQWRGDLSFCVDSPNAVDALIFSALSYLELPETLADNPTQPVDMQAVSEQFFSLPDYECRCISKFDCELLHAACRTERYGHLQLVQYRQVLDPEADTQFAAETWRLDNGMLVLAFRGTDNSLVGWKEDFNMSFLRVVPAQALALEYTREVLRRYRGKVILAGHSKGGNLAVFAAAGLPKTYQRRISAVYNMDGPGFTDYMMNHPGYQAMVPVIHTLVPQSSIIGMLLEHQENYTVIRSNQNGIMQHDLYSWQVMGSNFLPMQRITANSDFLNRTIKTWVSSMSMEERNRLVEDLFALLGSTGVDNTRDLLAPGNLLQYFKRIGGDPTVRKAVSEELQSLLDAAKKTAQSLEAIRE